MNEREIQGWKEIARRAPRRTKSAVAIAAMATFAAIVAFVGINAVSALSAPKPLVAVANAAPTSAPTTAPAASTPTPNTDSKGQRGRGFDNDFHDRNFGGFGRDGGMGGAPFMYINDDVAKALNLTTDQLRAQLMSGKSLSDIATAQKVDIQTVKDAIITSVQTQLAAQVKAGKLTQERADAIVAQMKANIDQIVNGKPGRRPGQPGQPPRKGDTTTPNTTTGL